MDGNVPNSYIVQNNKSNNSLGWIVSGTMQQLPCWYPGISQVVCDTVWLFVIIHYGCLYGVCKSAIISDQCLVPCICSSISFTNSYATVLPSSQIVFVLSGLPSTACLFSLPVIDFIWMVSCFCLLSLFSLHFLDTVTISLCCCVPHFACVFPLISLLEPRQLCVSFKLFYVKLILIAFISVPNYAQG